MAHQPGDGLDLLVAETEPRPGPLRPSARRSRSGRRRGPCRGRGTAAPRRARCATAPSASGWSRAAARPRAGRPRSGAARRSLGWCARRPCRRGKRLCSICATTRPNSGRKRPSRPTSFIRRKRRCRVLARGQHLQEQLVGRRVLAQLGVDPPQALGDRPPGLGMDVEIALLGQLEQLQHGERLALEQIGRRRRDPAALDDHAVDPPAAEAEPGEAETRPRRRAAPRARRRRSGSARRPPWRPGSSAS